MTATVIGPYHVGELPPLLTITFKDSTGLAISLTGYTAKFGYRKYAGSWTTLNATIDADQTNNKGQAHYTWVANDMAASGDYEGEMWIGNANGVRYASIRLAWQVKPALTPTPNI